MFVLAKPFSGHFLFGTTYLKKFLNPFVLHVPWVFYLAFVGTLPLHKAKWQNIAGSKKFFSTIHLRCRHLLGGRGQKLSKYADA